MIELLNHKLVSIKNSKYIFKCITCDNIIKIEHSLFNNTTIAWKYYLDYDKGAFFPLKDCHEMIIKNIIE